MPERDSPLSDDELPIMQADQRSDDPVLKPLASENRSTSEIASPRPRSAKAAQALTAVWPAIAVLILCIVGLSIWNNALVEKQRLQQDELLDAQQRIGELEKRLSTTDESMTQSSVVMQIRLKDIEKRTEELWTQMDKLWASAWRRNQTEIADHGKRLEGVDKDMVEHTELLKGLDAQLTEMQKSMSDLKVENADLAKHIKVFIAKEKELAKFKLQIETQAAENKKLRKQVNENSDWQKSNNAFRLQTNRNLERLENLIKQQASQTSATTVAP